MLDIIDNGVPQPDTNRAQEIQKQVREIYVNNSSPIPISVLTSTTPLGSQVNSVSVSPTPNNELLFYYIPGDNGKKKIKTTVDEIFSDKNKVTLLTAIDMFAKKFNMTREEIYISLKRSGNKSFTPFLRLSHEIIHFQHLYPLLSKKEISRIFEAGFLKFSLENETAKKPSEFWKEYIDGNESSQSIDCYKDTNLDHIFIDNIKDALYKTLPAINGPVKLSDISTEIARRIGADQTVIHAIIVEWAPKQTEIGLNDDSVNKDRFLEKFVADNELSVILQKHLNEQSRTLFIESSDLKHLQEKTPEIASPIITSLTSEQTITLDIPYKINLTNGLEAYINKIHGDKGRGCPFPYEVNGNKAGTYNGQNYKSCFFYNEKDKIGFQFSFNKTDNKYRVSLFNSLDKLNLPRDAKPVGEYDAAKNTFTMKSFDGNPLSPEIQEQISNPKTGLCNMKKIIEHDPDHAVIRQVHTI